MKRFFNLPTIIVLAITTISIIVEVLSPVTNWLAIIWMVIAAVWAVAARLNHMETQDWMQRYDSLASAFNTLKQTWSSTADELAELRGKYETSVQELEQANQKVNELTQNISSRKPTIKLKTKKHKTSEDKE